MENITIIIGENIAALRKANNLTQQQLADKINYSNKAVSRWEKGECLPNIETLSSLSDFFGVDFEYLIHRHEESAKIKKSKPNPNKIAIGCLAFVTVFTIATVFFVYVKVVHNVDYWQAFIWGVPLSALILLELCRRWSSNKVVRYIMFTVFLWSLITAVFLTVLDTVNLWPIYLIGIPIQIIIVLLFFVSKSEKK